MSNNSIGFIDRTLSGATTLSQYGPGSNGYEGVLHVSGSNGNQGVLCIPQSSSITGTAPLDCLCHNQDAHGGEILAFCRGAIGVFYSHSRPGKEQLEFELAYYNVAVQHINHFTTETLSNVDMKSM